MTTAGRRRGISSDGGAATDASDPETGEAFSLGFVM